MRKRKIKIIAKKYKLIYLLISLFLTNGCNEHKHNSKQETSKNIETYPLLKNTSFSDVKDSLIIMEHNPLEAIDDLSGKLEKLKYSGDTNIYNELSVAYFMAGDLHSFYYYSLLFANKYNYHRAYLDLYLALSEPYTGQGFEDLDRKTQRLALFYLLKSFELGNKAAKYDLEERFKDGKIPNSFEYSNLN